MKLPIAFKVILYYVLLILSCLTSSYFIYTNIDEVIKRSAGKYTLFSQMSWLTDKQAVWYCSILTIIFIALLTSIWYTLYHKSKRGAIVISILTLTFAIAILFLETLFYYKPV
jgi:hypothetical protein